MIITIISIETTFDAWKAKCYRLYKRATKRGKCFKKYTIILENFWYEAYYMNMYIYNYTCFSFDISTVWWLSCKLCIVSLIPFCFQASRVDANFSAVSSAHLNRLSSMRRYWVRFPVEPIYKGNLYKPLLIWMFCVVPICLILLIVRGQSCLFFCLRDIQISHVPIQDQRIEYNHSGYENYSRLWTELASAIFINVM